jgi:hypothetical protein
MFLTCPIFILCGQYLSHLDKFEKIANFNFSHTALIRVGNIIAEQDKL